MKLAVDFETTKVSFVSFDVDIDMDAVKSEFGLRAVPTIMIITNCGEHSTTIKADYDAISSYITKNLNA